VCKRGTVAIWAATVVLALHAAPGRCQAGAPSAASPRSARPVVSRPTVPDISAVRKLADTLSARARAIPTRSARKPPGGANAGAADLQKLVSSALAGMKAGTANGSAAGVDPMQLQKLLAAGLSSVAGPGGKPTPGGAVDLAAVQKMLASMLGGAGGSGRAAGQIDLTALKKILAGVIAQAGAPGGGIPASDLPGGMDQVMLRRAQEAIQAGHLGNARKLLHRVVKDMPQDGPAYSAAFRMAVRMEVMTRNLAARARQAERTGDHVAQASAMMKLTSAAGDSPQGRRAQAWLTSASKDPALAPAVREAKARRIASDLARITRSAGRISSDNDVIVTNVTGRVHPLVADLSQMGPSERRRLLTSIRRQFKPFGDTPTGQRILGQLADLEAGRPPRSAPRPPRRSEAPRQNWRSLRID